MVTVTHGVVLPVKQICETNMITNARILKAFVDKEVQRKRFIDNKIKIGKSQCEIVKMCDTECFDSIFECLHRQRSQNTVISNPKACCSSCPVKTS
ncbi:unnamed protein product [Bursaphelenchus okinawaensis]|uniref:Uncharacterized protein n=1 Tax=Bursaphelenchus okinawaensis TaxID=465554 RepID=A0A811K5T4_9BILA|nr:unnamed protein product [Bursaphelenchus okinawaensis]CAG9092033.1 unnamed protein product [Bursaphelenchus okinawaensis]